MKTAVLEATPAYAGFVIERVPLSQIGTAWTRRREGPGCQLVVVPG